MEATSQVLTLKKRVPYSSIASFVRSLPVPLEASEIEKQVRSFVRRLQRETPEPKREYLASYEARHGKEKTDRLHEENLRARQDSIRSEAKLFASDLFAQGTKKELCQKVSEHFKIKFSVSLLSKLKTLEKQGKLSHKSCLALIPKETKLSDKVLQALENLFRDFYSSFVMSYIPESDTFEEQDGVRILLNKVPTGKSETKTRKVKIQVPIDFKERAILKDFSFQTVLYNAEPMTETEKQARFNKLLKLFPHLGKDSNKALEAKQAFLTPRDEKRAHLNIEHVETILVPCAWKQEEREETYEQQEYRTYVTHRDKRQETKTRETRQGIIIVNGGCFLMKDVSRYLVSLFVKHDLDIPEDKKPYFKRDGKLFKSNSYHSPRFGLFDCINETCFSLWQEMLSRAYAKQRQFNLVELQERAFHLARKSFLNNLTEQRKLDNIETPIEKVIDWNIPDEVHTEEREQQVQRAYVVMTESLEDIDIEDRMIPDMQDREEKHKVFARVA